MSDQKPEVDVVDTPLEHPEKRVALSESGLRMIALCISVAGVILIGFNLYVYLTLHDLSVDNKDSIENLRKIQQPTAKEFEEQFEAGLRRCALSPRCRKLFPELAKAGDRSIRKQRTTARRRTENRQQGQKTDGGGSPSRGGGADRAPSRSSPPSSRRPRRPSRTPTRRPSNPPPRDSGPSNQPPPRDPPPLVSTPPVTTPQVGPIPSQKVPSVTVPCPRVDNLTCG